MGPSETNSKVFWMDVTLEKHLVSNGEYRNAITVFIKQLYLSDIVEIPVWNTLQLLQLCHFIQHLMKVEFGRQEVQSPVTVGFPAKILCY